MEEKEWTLMSRGERENILTRIGIKKEAVDRNAKVNFDFLDEDVKQPLAGTKLTVKDVVTRKDVHIIEREYMKGGQVGDVIKREYQVAVATYIKQGTDFHRGLETGIECVLKKLGVTPFEIVELYNEVVKNPNNFALKEYYGYWTSEVM